MKIWSKMEVENPMLTPKRPTVGGLVMGRDIPDLSKRLDMELMYQEYFDNNCQGHPAIFKYKVRRAVALEILQEELAAKVAEDETKQVFDLILKPRINEVLDVDLETLSEDLALGQWQSA